MPHYDFKGRECGIVREHYFRMADMPDHLTCGCGGRAESVISDTIEVLVKDNQKSFKLDHTCLPVGWERGNTDADKQERRYKKIINEERKAARASQKRAIKNGIRKIASVPRELHRMRTSQFGKDYYETDTKKKLKEDGLLFGD